MSFIAFLSNGVTTSMRGSGTLIDAIWLSGVLRAVVVHLDAVEQRRRGAAGAHGLELVPRRLDRLLHPPLRVARPGRRASRASFLLPGHQRAEILARRRRTMFSSSFTLKTRIGMAFSMHSESAVVSITRSPRSMASRCVIRRISRASAYSPRIPVEHALDAVLAHQQDVGADLAGAQGRRRVGREVRVAGAAGEDHDAPLLQVAHRAAADVRLGHLLDVERATARASTSPRRSQASCTASALSTVASMPA